MVSLSPSKAKFLLPPHCPAKFKQAVDNPAPESQVFDLGKLAHRLVLGAGSDLVVVDAGDWKTKAAQQARDKARAEDKIPCLPHELDNAQRMAERLHEHAVAGPLLADGDPEMPLRADDPATGVTLSGRPDWITPVGMRICVVEYKSCQTAEPQAFFRKGYDLGYLLQAVWYRALMVLMGMDEDPDFLWIAQEKDAPHLVSVVRPDPEAMAYGGQLMRRAIDTYAACRDADEWPGYEQIIHEGALPAWAYK